MESTEQTGRRVASQEYRDSVRAARNQRQKRYLDALRRQREWKEQQAASEPLLEASESAQERYRKHTRGITGTNPLPAQETE